MKIEKDDLISSIDRNPYIEVDGHESSGKGTLEQMVYFFGMSYVALKGIQLVKDTVSFEVKPSTLKYLDKGLSTAANPWWRVAGHTLSDAGTIRVSVGEIALEATKRAEEMLGGIPRTIGSFHSAASEVFTTPNSRLFISPGDLIGAESHYDALLRGGGHALTAEDRLRGLGVGPHEGKTTVFRLGPTGELDTPLLSDVTIRNRIWFPEGGADERYRQLNRALDRHSEAMGGRAVAHSNQSKFLVTKAQGPIKLTGVLAEAAETFGVRAPIEDFLTDRITGSTHEALREARIKAAELTKRAMSVLDSPLEIYEELLHGGPDGSRGLLKSAKDSKGYSYFKNLMGTGGNYTGGTSDMLVRHAGRIAISTAVLATGYQAVSMATELFTGQSADQVAGEVVGAAERLYAASSDLTGLTSLNKAQEREAPGSGRLAGVASFGISGYITGQMFAASRSLVDTPDNVLRWSAVRQTTHDAPGPLKNILGKGTRGRQYGLMGAMIGLAASSIFLPGALGSTRSLDEVISEQSGETEVAVRKGAGWEMSRTDIEGEQIMYYRPNWFARLQDDPFDELQHGDYGDRPVTRFLKGIVDPYWKEKELYYQRPYPITGADTSGFGVLGTLWGATVGGILKPTKYMHTGELSYDGQEGAERGEVSIFGERVSELPSEELGARGPARVVSPYSKDFMLGELAYKATEAVGLPGYLFSAAKKRLTGEQDFGTEEPVLETFARVGSVTDNFWSLNIGGGYGTTESFRRMFPDERFQLEKINPILNEMPSWLPGAGSFTDFQHGDPYCVDLETFIETPEGEVKAENIKIGDLIKNHLGEWAPVAAIAERMCEEGIKLVASGLSRYPLIASKEHPILTREGWKDIGEIDVGEYIGYPMPDVPSSQIAQLDLGLYTSLPKTEEWIYILGDEEYCRIYEYIEKAGYHNAYGHRKDILQKNNWSAKKWENAQRAIRYGSVKRIKRFVNINKDLGLILGYYISEGSASTRAVSFAFHINETDFRQELGEALEKVFGKSGATYRTNQKYKGRQSLGCNYILGSKVAAEVLGNLVGKGFDRKNIPNIEGNLEYEKALVKGIFNGDGSYFFDRGKPRVSIKLKNPALLRSLRRLLLKHEFVLSLNSTDSGEIRGQEAKRFAIYFETQKYKETKDSSRTVRYYKIADGYLWLRVNKIEVVSLTKVIGFRVDQGNSFCVFGIATHNSKLPEGEYRLPGAGYENRFPELEGLSPEDYPDIHKYKILADVAPYSKQLTEIRKRVETAAQSGELSERDLNIFRGTEQQLVEKEQRIRFEDGGDGLIGSYWRGIKHIARANPAEHLIPFSPVHKFAGPVDAISEYETRNLYSKASPAWDSPLSDFILPAIQSPLHALGFDFVPREAQEQRDLTGYFDKLEYIKNKKLEATAREQGVSKAAFAYARKAEYTMYGADPFGNVEDIMKVLPGSERPYFKDFLEATSNEEKSQILQITPEYTRKFYLGQWQKQIYSSLAMKGDLNSDEQAAIQQIEATRALEGETVSEGVWEDYQSDQFWGGVKQNTFPDYARARNLSYYFEDSAPLPEPPTDWLGYNPDVSMKGVKLKVVQDLGKDFHDFDLWESDVHMSRRSDYLDTAADSLLNSGDRESTEDLIKSLQRSNLSELDVEIVPTGGEKTRVSFDVGTDRSDQLKKELERMGYRYGV